MNLYLVQHAQAVSKEQNPSRPLSELGIRDANTIVSLLKPLKLTVESIWHSGKTRSLQTAEILAKAVPARKGLIEHKGLAPNDDPTHIAAHIEKSDKDTMLVGHMPFVGKLASLLLTGDQDANTIIFQQGIVVCLEHAEANHWHLLWAIPPGLISF